MNELPIMPIRAKYADELSEGSPDRKKLDNLPVTLNVADIKSLTTAQCNALKCGDIVTKEDSTGKHAYIVTFKKDGTGMCLTYADGSGYIETVSYDLIEGEWVYNSTDVFDGSECAKMLYLDDADVGNLSSDLISKIVNGKYKFLVISSDIFTITYLGTEYVDFTYISGEEGIINTYEYEFDNESWEFSALYPWRLVPTDGATGDVLTLVNGNPEWIVPGTRLYKHAIKLANVTIDGHDMSVNLELITLDSNQYTSWSNFATTFVLDGKLLIQYQQYSVFGRNVTVYQSPYRVYFMIVYTGGGISYGNAGDIKFIESAFVSDTVTRL